MRFEKGLGAGGGNGLWNRLVWATALLTATGVALAAPAERESRPTVQADRSAELPPLLPWDGASRSLVAEKDDPWITPAEVTGLKTTPDYATTLAWLERLVEASPKLRWVSLGSSPEGRPMGMVVASAEGAATPEELHASGKPVLLAHGGIHSGEIDGKDAGLMLLRDLTVGGHWPSILEGASLLFIPVLNPDGHERSSPYGRVNQRGPEEMGWRTNARNLNLNRDFAKLDTEEVRTLVGVLNDWQPDLYLDLHVTDGADYQYDITFGHNGAHGLSPAIGRWLDQRLTPMLHQELEAAGHIPGPLVFLMDNGDPTRGNLGWTSGPRFSNGYGDARHLATVLVENHSLKPYDQRVLGTYVLMVVSLGALGDHGEELRAATAKDRRARRERVPLGWTVDAEKEHQEVSFLGIESKTSLSPISGTLRLEYTGKPVTLEIPFLLADKPVAEVERPKAYWIPAAWSEVIRRLELHGIEMERLAEPREVEVTMYRLQDPQLDDEPFEGHVRVSAETTVEKRTEIFPPGSVRISTDQPLGDLAILLLEPAAADSFFQWGFFHSVLQRTEYMEGYVVEPLAERMLAEDPQLEMEFRKALLSDPELAADPRARLRWFYARTPYFDARWRLYPVARE
jgi:hypothetical protein